MFEPDVFGLVLFQSLFVANGPLIVPQRNVTVYSSRNIVLHHRIFSLLVMMLWLSSAQVRRGQVILKFSNQVVSLLSLVHRLVLLLLCLCRSVGVPGVVNDGPENLLQSTGWLESRGGSVCLRGQVN